MHNRNPAMICAVIPLISSLIISFCSVYVHASPRPKWLKDDRSRAGKINMRVLEGSPHTILRRRMQWIEGDLACQILLGTQMAVLETKEKAQQLAQAIMDISVWNNTKPDFLHAIEKYEYGLNRRYWIGLSDLPELDGHYIWKINDLRVTERLPILYDFWYINQPDHLLTTWFLDTSNPTNPKYMKKKNPMEHCVALWNPTFYKGNYHSYNDEPCNKRYYVICDNPSEASA